MKTFITAVLLVQQVMSFAQSTITLQPDELHSKDASLGYHPTYGTQNLNYENDTYFKAFTFLSPGDTNKNRGVIDFEIEGYYGIRTGLVSAKLSLYAAGYVNPTMTGHMGNNAAVIRRITQSWDESLVTWNNAPSSTQMNQVFLSPSIHSLQDYLDVDVTSLVRDMMNDTASGSGFLLQLVNELPGNALVFYSSSSSDPLKRPKLTLTFDPTDVSEHIIDKLLRVYPNPFTDHIQITSSQGIPINQVVIFNSLGQVIYTNSVVTSSLEISLGELNLPASAYIVRLITEEGVINKVMMKH